MRSPLIWMKAGRPVFSLALLPAGGHEEPFYLIILIP